MEKVIFAVYLDKSYQVQYVTMTPSEAKLPGWGMKILDLWQRVYIYVFRQNHFEQFSQVSTYFQVFI